MPFINEYIWNKFVMIIKKTYCMYMIKTVFDSIKIIIKAK